MTVTLEHKADLTYAEGQDPGKWKGAVRDGVRTALMSCPKCGGVASLSGHKIDDSGRVRPSVVCPFRGCTFHEYVILNGWTPTIVQHTSDTERDEE